MSKSELKLNLSVTILREGDRFVAYSPSLDLATSGKTFKNARERFAEATLLFFEELKKQGTTEEALKSLGWQKKQQKAWQPPIVVSHESTTISVPLSV